MVVPMVVAGCCGQRQIWILEQVQPCLLQEGVHQYRNLDLVLHRENNSISLFVHLSQSGCLVLHSDPRLNRPFCSSVHETLSFFAPLPVMLNWQKLSQELMASKNMGRIGPYIVAFFSTIASPFYLALDIPKNNF